MAESTNVKNIKDLPRSNICSASKCLIDGEVKKVFCNVESVTVQFITNEMK